MKLLYIGSGAALAIFTLSSCATSIEGPPTATGGAAATGAGGNATGAGGNAAGAGGAAQGAGGAAQGAGGAAQGAGGAAQGAGGAGQGAGGAAQGAGGAAQGAGGSATASECEGGGINMGLVDNGVFCGYAWTATNKNDEVIDPPCGDAGPCFEDGGASLCTSGSIPANVPDDDIYTGVMIGINAADEGDTWTAAGAGISVTFAKGGATGVARVMIQSGGEDYCVDAATSGANYAWSDFSVGCWDGGDQSPVFSAGEPVTAFAVQINGDDTAQTFADFCISDITAN